MATVNARMLRQLGGVSCVLAERRVTFAGPPGRAQVTAGGEGYVLRATVDDDRSEIIIKIYRTPSAERHRRIEFLTGLDLGRHLGAFWAAPLSAVKADAQLRGISSEVEVIPLEGLICPFVQGDCLSTLFAQGYDPPLLVRARLASHLVNAVSALEACKIAHGDLAATNVMVRNAHEAGAQLLLIDYDGFHHPNVPAIPIANADGGGRGWGTDGYRSPRLRVGSSAIVSTDRVALAALVFEIMVAQPGDFERIGRDTLVDQGEVDETDTLSLPPEIQARWSRGWSLVRQAFGQEDPAQAPAPSDWISELQRIAVHGWPSPSPYALRLCASGQPARRVLLVSDRSVLGSVVPELAGLSYARTNTGTVLYGDVGTAIDHIDASGARASHAAGSFSTPVSVGDRLQIHDLEIQVE